MKKSLTALGVAAVCATFFSATAFAAANINQVRVVNNSDRDIYIHIGGYPAASKLKPGSDKIYSYPFKVYPPDGNQEITVYKLVATAGGRWLTTPNGFTYLHKPSMIACLDYDSDQHKHKTGNRVWTINNAQGFDQGCEVKGYKQPWYTPN